MKLPCAVIHDLLPLYAEKMVETETQTLVEEHLADCPDCRRRLSEMESESAGPVETVKPLLALKKKIRSHRWLTAAVAALCVFIVVYTFFCHKNAGQLLPWEDGLIEVKGIETIPYEDISGYSGYQNLPEDHGDTVEALVLRMDSRINGIKDMITEEDDGTTLLVLQAWSIHPDQLSGIREYTEMVFCPVPDRVIYSYGSTQTLLWGEPMNGGVEVLPRLALGYYVILAAVLAVVLGLLWFIFRSRNFSRILRQLFFAPVSYIAAHFLVKGIHTTSFFFERDLFHIVLLTAAVYAALTLVWQLWQRHRQEQ